MDGTKFRIFIMYVSLVWLWFLFDFCKSISTVMKMHKHKHTFTGTDNFAFTKWYYITNECWKNDDEKFPLLVRFDKAMLSFIMNPCSCSHKYINWILYVWLVKTINMGVYSAVKPTATLINTRSKYHRRLNTETSEACVCVRA